MSLDAAIERANSLGLRVHNLFQRDDGTWQANVRRRKADAKHDYHHAYGRGDTPGFALNYAIEIAEEDLANGLPEDEPEAVAPEQEEAIGWEDL